MPPMFPCTGRERKFVTPASAISVRLADIPATPPFYERPMAGTARERLLSAALCRPPRRQTLRVIRRTRDLRWRGLILERLAPLDERLRVITCAGGVEKGFSEASTQNGAVSCHGGARTGVRRLRLGWHVAGGIGTFVVLPFLFGLVERQLQPLALFLVLDVSDPDAGEVNNLARIDGPHNVARNEPLHEVTDRRDLVVELGVDARAIPYRAEPNCFPGRHRVEELIAGARVARRIRHVARNDQRIGLIQALLEPRAQCRVKPGEIEPKKRSRAVSRRIAGLNF